MGGRSSTDNDMNSAESAKPENPRTSPAQKATAAKKPTSLMVKESASSICDLSEISTIQNYYLFFSQASISQINPLQIKEIDSSHTLDNHGFLLIQR